MADSESAGPTSSGEDRKRRLPDWAVLAILLEAACVMIALAMPLTPSKTGSTWSPAQWFDPDPSYLMETVVYFVMTNVLFLVIGLAAWRHRRS